MSNIGFVHSALPGPRAARSRASSATSSATSSPRSDALSAAALGAAGLRAFARIVQAWKLSVDEQLLLLGAPARSTFFGWRKNPDAAALSRDTLERLSNLLGIYKALQILLPDASAADAWVRKPNAAPVFGGRSALEHMLAGNMSDLSRVRRYLDSVRGSSWG